MWTCTSCVDGGRVMKMNPFASMFRGSASELRLFLVRALDTAAFIRSYQISTPFRNLSPDTDHHPPSRNKTPCWCDTPFVQVRHPPPPHHPTTPPNPRPRCVVVSDTSAYCLLYVNAHTHTGLAVHFDCTRGRAGKRTGAASTETVRVASGSC